MNAALLKQARSELAGNVMTHVRPLTQDERLHLWWLKRNIILLELEERK